MIVLLLLISRRKVFNPKSVFDELVSLFLEAKNKRQVIVDA